MDSKGRGLIFTYLPGTGSPFVFLIFPRALVCAQTHVFDGITDIIFVKSPPKVYLHCARRVDEQEHQLVAASWRARLVPATTGSPVVTGICRLVPLGFTWLVLFFIACIRIGKLRMPTAAKFWQGIFQVVLARFYAGMSCYFISVHALVWCVFDHLGASGY